MKINNGVSTGTTQISGTLNFSSLTNDPQLNVLTFNSQSGQMFFTASNAIVSDSASYAVNATSSSYSVTASYAENAGGSAFPYTGSAVITGSLRVIGNITAQEFNTELVSSSIIYRSGSTKFGDTPDDTHSFTGSLQVQGSITGSLFGTSSYATNTLSASYALNGGVTRIIAGTNVSITNGGLGSVTISSTDTNTTYTAGTGLSLTGTTFSNTSPDQVVGLTGGGATSITGTYPNFTISSTDTNTITTNIAGTGISVSAGTGNSTITNTAPDRTVVLTGGGATSITGTYPNFTISSTDTNTTYTAGTGLSLTGTTFSNTITNNNQLTNGAGYTTNTGTVTSIGGTGGYGGLTLSGTVTTSGNLTLGGTPTGTWPIAISGNATTATQAGEVLSYVNRTDSATYPVVWNNGSLSSPNYSCAQVIIQSSTGTLQATTLRATDDVVAYYSSDRRFKDNITPISNALDKVKQIGGYEFDWNDNQTTHTGHDIGVIAQEVETIFPEIVANREDGYKSVKYERLIPVLIEAIKELQLQIDELKNNKA